MPLALICTMPSAGSQPLEERTENARGADNVKAVSAYRGASLVLAGERDRITPLALGQKVYAALPGTAKQWFVAAGATHNAIVGHKEVMPVYCDFVNAVSSGVSLPKGKD